MRLNFYVTFDNVYDYIDTYLEGPQTKNLKHGNAGSTSIWNFDHLKNMKIYPGRNLNQSLNQFGTFPMEFIDSAFIKDETKPEVNLILRLLSSNMNFNQLSMRATFNNCDVGTRFFLIMPTNINIVYDYYTTLYNSTLTDDIDPDMFARKSRLFGQGTYTESDMKETIDGAYARAENFFKANGSVAEGYFTNNTYQTNQTDQESNFKCRLLIKE
jgi:hypothetical protein